MTSKPRPRLRIRWMGAVWRLHRWLGLLSALPLLVVCLSGVLLVRHDWIEKIADPVLFNDSPPSLKRVPLGDLLVRLRRELPGTELRFIELPGDVRRNVAVSVLGSNGRRALVFDAVSGETLLDRAEADGARRFFLRIHDSLLMGKPGEIIVAISSLTLTASALTGLWIYRGAWRGLLRPRWRPQAGLRLWMTDLHKWAGVASLVLLLVWGVTGALLTLPGLLGAFGKPRPEKIAPVLYDWKNAPDVEIMLESARRTFPRAAIDYLSLPRTPEGNFTVSLIDRSEWFWAKFKEVEFGGRDGERLRVTDHADSGLLDRVNFTVGVLHFGHQGSAVMLWTWFLVGLAPVFLTISGAWIWHLKKRKRSITG